MTDEEYLRMRKAARRRRQHRQRNYHLFAGACVLWAIVIVWFIFLMWPRAAEPAPEPLEPAPEPVLATEEANEAERIEAALIEIGYLREDIPLSYEMQDILQTACEEFGVPYHLALGLIETESGFREEAVSGKGCHGLMQLNPKYFDVKNMTPADNIRAGVEYLGDLLGRFEDEHRALMAYNMGPSGAASLWAEGVVESGYSRKVSAAAQRWAEVVG